MDNLTPLNGIEIRVRESCVKAQRRRDDITIVAISKTRSPSEIEPLLHAGHRVFGENRVDEAQEKWPALRGRFPDVHLRLVGRLQTNKVNKAVKLFDAIDSLDRESLARALASKRDAGQRLPELLLQVNVGDEPQKGGVATDAVDDFYDWLVNDLHLQIAGVMGVPPAKDHPGPYFALLRVIRDRLGVRTLSMGMSGDFEAAIHHGATHIRIGSALFGHRKSTVNDSI